MARVASAAGAGARTCDDGDAFSASSRSTDAADAPAPPQPFGHRAVADACGVSRRRRCAATSPSSSFLASATQAPGARPHRVSDQVPRSSPLEWLRAGPGMCRSLSRSTRDRRGRGEVRTLRPAGPGIRRGRHDPPSCAGVGRGRGPGRAPARRNPGGLRGFQPRRETDPGSPRASHRRRDVTMRDPTRRASRITPLLLPVLAGLLLAPGPVAAQAGSDRSTLRGAAPHGDGLVVEELFPGRSFGSLRLTDSQGRRLRGLTGDFLGIFGDDLRRLRGTRRGGRVGHRHLGLRKAIRAYRRAVLGVLSPGQLRTLGLHRRSRRHLGGRRGLHRRELRGSGLGRTWRRGGLHRHGHRGLHRHRRRHRSLYAPLRAELYLELGALRLLLGDRGHRLRRLRGFRPGFGRGHHPRHGRHGGRGHGHHGGRGHRH